MKVNFRNILKGKVVIVGIGNTLRGDDSFGPTLVDRLNGRINAVCIDAGSAPENYLGRIAKEKPDTVLIVDAVHLGLSPGDYEILIEADILKSGFSTHDLSPHMFIEYIKRETGADIYLLGVQPQNVDFGESMSDSVEKTLDKISYLLKEEVCTKRI